MHPLQVSFLLVALILFILDVILGLAIGTTSPTAVRVRSVLPSLAWCFVVGALLIPAFGG